MATVVHPTRMELLMLKERLRVAKRGHELLQEKRDALIMEFFALIHRMQVVRKRVMVALEGAYSAFREALAYVGPRRVEEISYGMKESLRLRCSLKNLMGVRVASLKIEEVRPYYLDTPYVSAKLDEAIGKIRKAVKEIVKLAETFDSVRKMAMAVMATKRRVNSLEYYIIPKLEETIRWIELCLEEREREDFFRLKRIKSLRMRQRE